MEGCKRKQKSALNSSEIIIVKGSIFFPKSSPIHITTANYVQGRVIELNVYFNPSNNFKINGDTVINSSKVSQQAFDGTRVRGWGFTPGLVFLIIGI